MFTEMKKTNKYIIENEKLIISEIDMYMFTDK